MSPQSVERGVEQRDADCEDGAAADPFDAFFAALVEDVRQRTILELYDEGGHPTFH